MSKLDRRLLVMGDTHCGHGCGLTPPEYWWSPDRFGYKGASANTQRDMWKWYTETLKAVNAEKQIDTVFHLGDAIDGKGKRSEGVEQITTDMKEQAKMATRCLDQIGAERAVMVTGTPYHVGSEDMEEAALMDCNAETKVYGKHLAPNINGITFDLKHKIGGSSIPHGRFNALAKSRMWNVMWNADREAQPLADIFFRGHVHVYSGNDGGDWHGWTIDSLQGMGSRYGEMQCEGIVTIGLMVFDIKEDGSWTKERLRADLPGMKMEVIQL